MNFVKKNRAFTLIELLTVIAIIGILAGILIPTVGAVKTSANKSKTKVQFNQWAVAMQLFKTEYGYYPAVASSNKLDSPTFFAALTGKDYKATPVSDLKGNTRNLSFYSASDADIALQANGDVTATDGLLKDAFGNTDIAVFMDTDGDGMIKGSAELNATTKVIPVDGGSGFLPATGKIDTTNGIRAGVVFYSAGKGASATDIVYSWQ